MAQRVPPPFAARPPGSAPARPRAGPSTARMLEPAARKYARPADHRLAALWPRRPCAALLAASLLLAGDIGAATAVAVARDTHPRHASPGASAHAVPYLGLLLGGTVSDDQVIGLGLSDTELGRVVTSVDPGSPADRARIRWGDLILRADGRVVHSPHDVDAALRRHAPGTSLPLVIRRGQETLETTIVVGELPPAFIEHGVGPIFDRDPSCAQLPAGRTEADNLPIANWVGWGNPAIQRGGLEVGVLITALNGREVRSIAEFYEAASPVRLGDDVVVRFRSHGRLRQLSYLAQAPPLPESRLRHITQQRRLAPLDVLLHRCREGLPGGVDLGMTMVAHASAHLDDRRVQLEVSHDAEKALAEWDVFPRRQKHVQATHGR